MATLPSDKRPALALFPGHCIRRLQQAAVAAFMGDAEAASVTPVQFAVLYTLAEQPGIDQRTLARQVHFDTSTIGSVVDRMEARGLLTRSLSDQDRRVRLLHLTEEGARMLHMLEPSVMRVQDQILQPLNEAERAEFMRLAQRVVDHHGSVE
ncbi:MarR family winged helix-turn-helix transcriptional regulator [Paracidovorax sp. MALMAid1276]|uniref:MarR family winged helix-turn-helix transcriptional regulator n=1 Tax=Paracidovorax sp. MALMAid1276 TaxID=3411631 RepID=UPI003B9D650C